MRELSKVFERPLKYVGMREVYGEVLTRLGEKYEDIVVLDADLSSSTKTSIFAKKFPERFFNMGIAEQNMMGFAAGLAAAGKIPFVSTFAIFASGRAWEQIRQSIAYPSLNVKIVATHGGITVGEDGASHQCTEDIALMRVLPNMTIVVPTDAVETEKVIETIVKVKGPFYVRISRAKFPIIFDNDHRFQIGKGYILREGKDIGIIATGLMVSHALKAALMAEREGISVMVVSMPTIKPIDHGLVVEVARRTRAILTAEEHSVIGGLGSAVAEALCENEPVIMKKIGIKDKFGTSGKWEELVEFFELSPSKILEALKELYARKLR